MTAPRSMTRDTLDVRQGIPPGELNSLTQVAKPSPVLETYDQLPVREGSVVRLDADFQWQLGCNNQDCMPHFTCGDSDDPDAANDGGDPETDVDVWVAGIPERSDTLTAIPANAACELLSTQFVAGEYPPNTLLTSPTSGTNAGKLQAGTRGTETICGIVSEGKVKNIGNRDALAFYPHLHLRDGA